MIKITNAVIAFYLILLISRTVYPANDSPLFWEPEISNALKNRDDYYKQVGAKHNKTTFNILMSQNGSESLQEQLKLYKNTASPWYYFLSGLASLRLSPDTAGKAFSNAINSANNDPGLLWSLFFEFYYLDQSEWADTCLRLLEKKFCAVGAQTAPILSQQLLSFAYSKKASGNNMAFRKYLEWSARFERYPFWHTFMKGWSFLPSHPALFFSSCKQCIVMIQSSWFLQLNLLYYFYRWLRLAVLFFIIITFIALSLEAMPVALHPIIELFPSNLNVHFRYFLTLAMFASLSFAGIVPFFILTAVMIWPHIHSWKKALLSVALVFLALSPCDARISEMFRVSLSNDHPPGLFQRSLHEGYSLSLEKKVYENLQSNSEDHLLHISAAILNFKKNDIASSVNDLLHAEKIQPVDPVLLTLAGNVYYAYGDTTGAQLYYQRCVETYPNYAVGWFNAGQFNLFMKNLSEGNEQITKAATLDESLLNSFLDKNSVYFSDTLPLLRQCILGDYTPGYFWRKIFPRYTGTWRSSTRQWGLNTWGIPPLATLFIVPVITLLLLLLMIRSRKTAEKILFCKICGNPMCRKCKIEKLCKNCILATDAVNDEAKKKQVKTKIKARRYRLTNLTGIVLGLAFPGAGSLYKSENGSIFGIFLLLITSGVYALYGSLLRFDFSCPFWVVREPFIALFIGTLVYSLIGTVVFVKNVITELQPSEDNYVISWKSK